jgi:nucleotide-binding universal stress UspA family protein
MFSKILLCSDGSESAGAAARMGASIAQKFHSTVLLVHTYDPTITAYPAFGGGGWEFAASQDGLDAKAVEAQRAILDHTGRILSEVSLQYEPLLECGPPVETIARVAAQHQVDLIVLGDRGATGIESFLLGSVSEGVLHRAHCPVLIVRGDSPTPPQHVLLASDGSEGASQAALAAIRIAQEFTAALRVLNILDAASLPYSLSPSLSADSETPYTHAEHLLAKITDEVHAAAANTGVIPSFHQETGVPAEIIVAFAHRQEADLIVIGSRGRGALTSLLLGSVSNSVAHHAHCSVLVVR